MTQIRISRPRTASTRRRDEPEQLLPLDARDPDVVRAKRLQRRLSQPGAARRAR